MEMEMEDSVSPPDDDPDSWMSFGRRVKWRIGGGLPQGAELPEMASDGWASAGSVPDRDVLGLGSVVDDEPDGLDADSLPRWVDHPYHHHHRRGELRSDWRKDANHPEDGGNALGLAGLGWDLDLDHPGQRRPADPNPNPAPNNNNNHNRHHHQLLTPPSPVSVPQNVALTPSPSDFPMPPPAPVGVGSRQHRHSRRSEGGLERGRSYFRIR